jgi:hypothetical protein
MKGSEIDLAAVNDAGVESGVAFGAELLAYTDAVMSRDAPAIAKARDVVEEKLGPEGVVDSAAVMMMFNVVDRVADATGIPIDDGMTKDMRYAIGSELGMGHLTPEERASR